MNKTRRSQLGGVASLMVLILSVLACRGVPGGLIQATPTPIPVSSESVEQLVQDAQAAAQTAMAGGTASLTITEQQLTSLIAIELAAQPDIPVQNVQVRLTQGQMQISGQVQQEGLSLPLTVALSITVDGQGRPRTQVLSAKLGPLPVPQAILDELTAQIDKNLIEQFGAYSGGLVFESIAVYEGYMVLTGRMK